MAPTSTTRRDFARSLAAGAALVALGARTNVARGGAEVMRTRSMPRSGEAIPVIGLGTWQTFDVGDVGARAEERAPRTEVLRLFFGAGGRLIDSSPMYGRAESVAGELVEAGGHPAWFATKVWTRGAAEGRAQMLESMRRLRTEKLDLMQVHNLLDWKAHLPTMRALRDAGRIRYLGITHYALGAFDELEQVIRTEQLDFVQLPYSVRVRQAEARLLPAAADTGTAVIVMRPFEEGALFDRVKGRAVPAWATERGFESWAELFLAFILGHPAVTCVIPATSKPKHLAQNVRAGLGPLLDEPLRTALAAELAR